MKRHRLLLGICGFILVVGQALGLACWSSPVYANVTLVSFTATYLPGSQAMRLDWETATEFDMVGFYVGRSTSSTGSFAQVSPFIPHEGDTVVGATYVFTDSIPVVNQFYYYRLEVVNNDQTIDYHGPITATAGVPATNTFTPTRTHTPTSTPSSTPTATPTTRPSVPAATSSRRIEATPRIPIGATITPRPTFTSPPPSPAAFTATPTLASAPANSQPSTPSATSMTPLPNVSPLATAVPPPSATNIAQALAPALPPAEATPGVAAPVVVAEASPPAAPPDSTLGEALLLVVAAILFLGIAFVILRQVRQ